MQKAEIIDLVLTSLRDVLAEMGAAPPASEPVSADTQLVGRSAVLDSLGLVRLILEVEQRLSDTHDVVVTLADERAMSQQRSPFRTVATLADYIEMLAKEGSGRAGS
jgi:acyl carrier protein